MTIVAMWLEDDILWAASDSRISDPGTAGGTKILTDAASKLFIVPIECRDLSQGPGLVPEPSIRFEIGFAFAGSALPAMMTLSMASSFVRSLCCTEAQSPPAIADIAHLFAGLLKRFCDELSSANNGNISPCEIALFGYCPALQAFRIYHMPYAVGVPIHLIAVEPSSEPLILGGGKGRFAEHLQNLKEGNDAFHRTSRLPKLAIERMIVEGKEGIGGGVALMAASSPGKVFSFVSVEPVNPGEPAAKLVFNGIDVSEIGPVGNYRVMQAGMA